VSELQLRLDSVKQEAGANKLKLQVSAFSITPIIPGFLHVRARASFRVCVCLYPVSAHNFRALTRLLQALVAEWEQVQAAGGEKSLSAGSIIDNQPKPPAKTMQPANTFVTGSLFYSLHLLSADAELKRKVEAMHAGQAKVALLKNQAQDAQAVLSGAVVSFLERVLRLC
jgi:hypothetical protein